MNADQKKLANALPQIIWTCDAEGRFEWVNERWVELTGLSEEESLREKDSLVAVHPDDREQLRRRFDEARAAGSPCEIEYRIRNRQGAYRFHLCRVAPVRDEAGTITSWVAAAFDMQDRREAESALRDSERRFETVFHLNPLPSAITRLADGRFLSINDAFFKMTGYSRGEVIGKTTIELGILTPEQRAALVAPIAEAGSTEFDLPLRSKDGRTLTLEVVVARIDFGGEPCLLIVAVDVTDRRATETALLEADRRKDEFLALLSHELRNPLAPILTAAQIMQLRGDVATPYEREVIVRQAQHLVRLVDDLLDVSRLARGKLTLTKKLTELSAVVAKAVEATAPLLEQRRHRLNLSVPSHGLYIDADDVRLAQVIGNLLTNAALYTDPDGRIDVTGGRENDQIVLRVRDNGAGIDPALLPRLFEMFVQDPRGSDRTRGGLGLGLSLARTLTNLHGGTVSAHSAGAGQGSEFTLRLPASAPPDLLADPPVRRRREISAGVGHRVLVVDDNPDAASTIGRFLSEVGYEVQIAGDASQALSAALAVRPHVAVIDIGLPVMDGYTLGRELRARMGGAVPELIALTGYGQEQDQRRSAEAGFAAHLVKPVDAERLTRLVDALVGKTF
jgi:PAS domain S-box-containing protein